jgi:hypothetical protein
MFSIIILVKIGSEIVEKIANPIPLLPQNQYNRPIWA